MNPYSILVTNFRVLYPSVMFGMMVQVQTLLRARPRSSTGLLTFEVSVSTAKGTVVGSVGLSI